MFVDGNGVARAALQGISLASRHSTTFHEYVLSESHDRPCDLTAPTLLAYCTRHAYALSIATRRVGTPANNGARISKPGS